MQRAESISARLLHIFDQSFGILDLLLQARDLAFGFHGVSAVLVHARLVVSLKFRRCRCHRSQIVA